MGQLFMMGFDGTEVTPQIKILIERHYLGTILLTAKNLICQFSPFVCTMPANDEPTIRQSHSERRVLMPQESRRANDETCSGFADYRPQRRPSRSAGDCAGSGEWRRQQPFRRRLYTSIP